MSQGAGCNTVEVSGAKRMPMVGKTYVQYGCGLCAPEGWINFDTSPTLRLQRLPVLGGLLRSVLQPRFPDGVRLGDIIRGLPIPEGSCQGIYCSHVLEHLSLEDCRLALRNSRQYLAAGGRFRLVLPDLHFAVTTYLENPRADASIEFMEKSLLGWKSRPRGIKGLVHSWLTNARHLWMWDEKSLAAELSAAGFSSVRRASFGDSDDPHFEAVETPSRWENCLGFECIK